MGHCVTARATRSENPRKALELRCLLIFRERRPGGMRSSRMMSMKKHSEAVSQERVVRNGSLKERFLHVPRQLRPQLERGVTQQELKLPGQIIHMPPCFLGQ